MGESGNTHEKDEQTRRRLIALLGEMSAGELEIIEKFALFIQQEGGQSIVSVVEREGDTLADTEALYDDV